MKILVAGDFVPNQRVATNVELGNYSCLDEVRPIIDKVDYAIVNFESPVVIHEAKPIDKTGPNLKCTEKAMECIAQVGFHCVTLANNHFRDYGQAGVADTIDSCLKNGIKYVGGGKTKEEAEQILYENVDDKTLAIINVCENEWSVAGKNYGGSASLNPVENYYKIQEARKNADYVLVIVHGGIEGYQYPTPRMIETYRFFVDAGADAVVNHHQHCFSGCEVYKEKPIFYGLGNFCFDRKEQRGSIWNEGYMVEINFSEGCTEYNIIPYIQCDEKPTVVLQEGEKLESFNKRIAQINEVIANKELLQKHFSDKVDSMYEYRLLALEPIDNQFVKNLQNRKLFPRLVRREQRKSMLMRIRCESNSELLIGVLKKYFNL